MKRGKLPSKSVAKLPKRYPFGIKRSSHQTRMSMQVQDYFYNFVNGFYMMKQIPIMWNVIKMCIIVFATVATTFIIAFQIRGFGHQFWIVLFDNTITITFTSFTVIYIGSIISAILLVYYSVRIGLIFKRNRQLKSTK